MKIFLSDVQRLPLIFLKGNPFVITKFSRERSVHRPARLLSAMFQTPHETKSGHIVKKTP